MSDYSWVGVGVGRKGTRSVLYSFVVTTWQLESTTFLHMKKERGRAVHFPMVIVTVVRGGIEMLSARYLIICIEECNAAMEMIYSQRI